MRALIRHDIMYMMHHHRRSETKLHSHLSGRCSAPSGPQTSQPGRAAGPASCAELRRLTGDTQTERSRSRRRKRRRRRCRRRVVGADHSPIAWCWGRGGGNDKGNTFRRRRRRQQGSFERSRESSAGCLLSAADLLHRRLDDGDETSSAEL